jgi:type II secretory pathway predicted ATPase ExeA
MDTPKLLKEVKKEIKRLQKIAKLLGEGSGKSTSGRKLSAAARKKIADGQKKRWAKVRAEKAKG